MGEIKSGARIRPTLLLFPRNSANVNFHYMSGTSIGFRFVLSRHEKLVRLTFGKVEK